MDDDPNFSVGSVILPDTDSDSEANFSLEFEDLSDIEDSSLDDQIGDGNSYTIRQIQERHIRKFNVQGYDYQIHVDAFDRNLEFTGAVQLLHGIITGKDHSKS